MKLIVACDVNGGIGYKNSLPWNKIKDDLPRFRNLTEGGVVIMGRNTWESLPIKPLPNRINFIVTSKTGFFPRSCFTIPNLNYLSNFKNGWIIGGAKLINTSWDLIDEVHLTKTIINYDCDSYINLFQLKQNYKIKTIQNNEDHTYEVYVKNATIS